MEGKIGGYLRDKIKSLEDRISEMKKEIQTHRVKERKLLKRIDQIEKEKEDTITIFKKQISDMQKVH